MFTKIEAEYPIQLPNGHVVRGQIELDRSGNFQLNFCNFDFGTILAEQLLHETLEAIDVRLLLRQAVPAGLEH